MGWGYCPGFMGCAGIRLGCARDWGGGCWKCWYCCGFGCGMTGAPFWGNGCWVGPGGGLFWTGRWVWVMCCGFAGLAIDIGIGFGIWFGLGSSMGGGGNRFAFGFICGPPSAEEYDELEVFSEKSPFEEEYEPFWFDRKGFNLPIPMVEESWKETNWQQKKRKKKKTTRKRRKKVMKE